MGIFLGAAKIDNIVCGLPNLPDILGINSRCSA